MLLPNLTPRKLVLALSLFWTASLRAELAPAVAELKVTQIDATTATVSLEWSLAAGAPPYERFVLERKEDGKDWSAKRKCEGSDVPLVDCVKFLPATTGTYRDTIKRGVGYRWRLRYEGSSASGSFASAWRWNTPDKSVGVFPPPLPPNKVTVWNNASASALELSWNRNSFAFDQFVVERAPGTSGSFQSIAVIPASQNWFSDTGLSAETSYRYRISGRFLFLNPGEPSPVVTGTTIALPPALVSNVLAPSGLMGSVESFRNANSQVKVVLTWNDNSANETGFAIQRKRVGNEPYETIVSRLPPNTTKFEDTTARFDARYLYRVRALPDSQYSKVYTQDTSPFYLSRAVLCATLEKNPNFSVELSPELARYFTKDFNPTPENMLPANTSYVQEPWTPPIPSTWPNGCQVPVQNSLRSRKTILAVLDQFPGNDDYAKYRAAAAELSGKGNAILLFGPRDYVLDRYKALDPNDPKNGGDITFRNVSNLRIIGCGDTTIRVKGDVYHLDNPPPPNSAPASDEPQQCKSLEAAQNTASLTQELDPACRYLNPTRPFPAPTTPPTAALAYPSAPTGRNVGNVINPLNIENASHVEVEGLTLEGGIDQGMERPASWIDVERHGIGILTRGCYDCTFKNLKINRFAKDGVYIGNGFVVPNCGDSSLPDGHRLADEAIRLHNVVTEQNTRLGVTVVQAAGVWISNVFAPYTGDTGSEAWPGARPMAAMDWEPNHYTSNRADYIRQINALPAGETCQLAKACKNYYAATPFKVNRVTTAITAENFFGFKSKGNQFQAALAGKPTIQWPVAKTENSIIRYSRFIAPDVVSPRNESKVHFGMAIKNGTVESSYLELKGGSLNATNAVGTAASPSINDALIRTTLIGNDIKLSNVALNLRNARHPIAVVSNRFTFSSSELLPCNFSFLNGARADVVKRDPSIDFNALQYRLAFAPNVIPLATERSALLVLQLQLSRQTPPSNLTGEQLARLEFLNAETRPERVRIEAARKALFVDYASDCHQDPNGDPDRYCPNLLRVFTGNRVTFQNVALNGCYTEIPATGLSPAVRTVQPASSCGPLVLLPYHQSHGNIFTGAGTSPTAIANYITGEGPAISIADTYENCSLQPRIMGAAPAGFATCGRQLNFPQ